MPGIGIGISPFFSRGSTPSYDADSVLYFEQLSIQPLPNRKRIISDYFLALKAANCWNEADRIVLYNSQDEQAATISLKNPTSTAQLKVGGMTFTASEGFQGNGSTGYLNTKFNPFTQGVKYVQNSNSLLLYSNTNAQSSGCDFGHHTGTGTPITQVLSRYTDNNFYARANNTAADGSLGTANLNSSGLISIRRTSANNVDSLRNGVVIESKNLTSAALPNNEIFVCAQNANGTPADFTTRQYSVFCAGSGALDHLAFYNATQNYLDAVLLDFIL